MSQKVLFKLLPAAPPRFSGYLPAFAHASRLALPRGEPKAVGKLEQEKAILAAQREGVMDLAQSLFNSQEVSEAYQNFLNNPVFVYLARDPKLDKNKQVLKEYFKCNNYFLNVLISSRVKQLETVPLEEPATRLYEEQKIESLKKYKNTEYATMLKAFGLDPEKLGEPDQATLDYEKFLMEDPPSPDASSYAQSLVARAACAIGWSLCARRLFDDKLTVKEGPFWDYVLRANVAHPIEYVTETGELATYVSEDSVSATAFRLAQQLNYRLGDSNGNLLWNEKTRKSIVEKLRKGLEAEYNCAVAIFTKIHGPLPTPIKGVDKH
ncbi:hypothetical protein B0T26DRAFT_749399 [Lasiosphaeria miniovina]|uniref:Uncharacterized protein n=1 Tax=Lasiosphaeria miniovina TaxID=1954250 RepID=A0AA40ATY3_9PEZI|nr:uncharacterized protein B0T26DRAFT_749399 [Lasiosphaeria miniovina]KAK0721931.1 hypothetical protein B0T26DRAFT_749399 [Lasiosphaeria miniovina]